MIEVPILPVRDIVVFPKMMVPLFLGREPGIQAVEATEPERGRIFVVTQRNTATEEPGPDDCYPVGCLCTVVRKVPLADGRLKVLVHGEARARLAAWPDPKKPFVEVELLETEPVSADARLQAEALARSILESLDRVIELGRQISPDMLVGLDGLPFDQLPDAIAAQVGLATEDAYRILDATSAMERLKAMAEVLARESGVLGVKAEFESQIKEEFTRSQREYLLREQIRAMRTELGENDERSPDVTEFEEKVRAAKLPPETRKEAEKQLKRLEQMHPDSAEASIIKSYLDWIIDLPWMKATKDRVDLAEARRILDEDHYNLKKVKQRVLEFLGVRKLKGDLKGPILCFVGPPGVGKTSLGKSIAKSLGRKFVRISLGGMKDEAEIRGHRRTYVGSMPGRIIQGLKQAGVRNPVFVLDEIDKVGTDFRGDPASALLEVLDPEQNKSFSDHYLSIPFDLSEVLFIATANVLDPVPAALRDRMEVIELSGYSEEEKLHIARKFILPRQLEENGITEKQLYISDAGISAIVSSYTRESGLRNLEREIASVCRKVALDIAEGKKTHRHLVTNRNLPKYLGQVKYEPLTESATDEIGVATGLAWTPYGGEMLYVEVQMHRSKKGRLTLTGQLGDVMKESAHAAISYVRTRPDLGSMGDFFEKHDIHLHVPEGAIPKDGPSAGVTMATALYSAVSGRPVRKQVAMTGEINLRGRVLPVGGIREKLLAARRMGVKKVLIPKQNVRDLEELPRSVRSALEIVPVESMDEVLKEALLERPARTSSNVPTAGRKTPARTPKRPGGAVWTGPTGKRTPPSS